MKKLKLDCHGITGAFMLTIILKCLCIWYGCKHHTEQGAGKKSCACQKSVSHTAKQTDFTVCAGGCRISLFCFNSGQKVKRSDTAVKR